MSDRPSDGWELDELRDEFDWMFEFNSRMAERIREDPDVHNLASYVSKLEQENAELRELCGFVLMFTTMTDGCGDTCPYSCNNCQNECYFRKRARELGVEV